MVTAYLLQIQKQNAWDQGSDYYGANFTGSNRIEESNHNLISLGWVGNWNYFTSGIHSDQEAKSDFLKNYRFLHYTQTATTG